MWEFRIQTKEERFEKHILDIGTVEPFGEFRIRG